jgi:1-acyl-sn-glycerol-3-phosphate acyltransferase
VADVERSDWLPGTVQAVYGSREAELIAIKEHLSIWTGLHPRVLPEALPLNRFPLSVTRDEGPPALVRVVPQGPPELDLQPVRDWWDRWFQLGRWPVEDLFMGLIQRFVRRVIVADPAAFAAKATGRSVLFLANHQVGLESLLFSVLGSALVGTPTLTLAKAEHRHTWIGHLIQHSFRWPGARDPRVITYFDREDKSSLLVIAQELGHEILSGERSVMVHVEGTRSLSCREPVQKMSSIFIDLSTQTGVPIVPVRFVGGLPAEPLAERLEYPIGLGRQDIYLGAPIDAAELAALPPGQRKARVISAINALGPSNAWESPLPGDPEQEASARAWSEATGARIDHAVLLRVLQAMPDLSPELRRLLEAAEQGAPLQGEDEASAWLRVLYRWFLPGR